MVDRRYLQVLPGGRSGAEPGPSDSRADGGSPRLQLLPPLPGAETGAAIGARASCPPADGQPATEQSLLGPADPPPDTAGSASPGSAASSAERPAAERPAAGTGRHRRDPQAVPAGLQRRARLDIRAAQAAQLLSGAGDQVARVAIAVLVYGQTRSALLTAAAYALTYLPPLLAGQSVSRLTGAVSRRAVMIGIDLARAIIVTAMALPGTHLMILCALLVAATLLGAPFSAARAALVRDTARIGRTASDPGLRFIGYQAGQVLGFMAGAGLVAVLQPRRTLLVDAMTFLVSACILAILVRRPQQPCAAPASGDLAGDQRAVTAGADIVARSSTLRTLALLGWLAGFYVVPECLAVPYARSLGGGTLTVGLLMAAMPAGATLGAVMFTRLVSPPNRMKPLVELALLSCVPLIFCAFRPPLWAVLGLLALAGAGSCYQLAALTAFVRALARQLPPDNSTPGDPRTSALGFAQAGLLAAQCLGFVAAGGAAQLVGAPAAVSLAGLCGMAATTALARSWGQEHAGGRGSCTLAGRQRPALSMSQDSSCPAARSATGSAGGSPAD